MHDIHISPKDFLNALLKARDLAIKHPDLPPERFIRAALSVTGIDEEDEEAILAAIPKEMP